MKILFAASEIFPYAKTGGLADVAYALPRSLSQEMEIVSVMPLYGFMSKSLLQKSECSFNVLLADTVHKVTLYEANYQGVTTYFIESPLLSETKDLYSKNGGSYGNNSPYFGLFCAAIVELAKELAVDIVHLNDWQTALAALWIRELAPHIKTIFTIHNLAYQGLFDASALQYFGIDSKYFTLDGIEFYEHLSFIKAGIAYSDRVTTVSPQYAKDILTQKFGCGLDTFLRQHSHKLSGILNGIDGDFFNPQTDKALVKPFGSKDLNSKYFNKKALIEQFGLKDPEKPLFIMVSRLVHQKGFDLLLESMDQILKKDINLVIQVDGINSYRYELEFMAQKHENIHLVFGYDEEQSHRLYGAGDFLLMPSLFEPCGLSQMIAMRYGAIPIVHGVGGLLDTVHEDKDRCGKGIVFMRSNKEEFISAIDRALDLKNDPEKMQRMITDNMACDFSFKKSTKAYIKLYKELLL